MKRGMFRDKKGEGGGEDILWPQVIFILFNLIIFVSLLTFVYVSSNGALVYQEAYAKQIALFLNKAEPGVEAKIDFSKGFEVAEQNNFPAGSVLEISNGEVRVSLGRGGYVYPYSSGYEVSSRFEGDYLVLGVSGGVHG